MHDPSARTGGFIQRVYILLRKEQKIRCNVPDFDTPLRATNVGSPFFIYWLISITVTNAATNTKITAIIV
jgi:hypothetical protein